MSYSNKYNADFTLGAWDGTAWIDATSTVTNDSMWTRYLPGSGKVYALSFSITNNVGGDDPVGYDMQILWDFGPTAPTSFTLPPVPHHFVDIDSGITSVIETSYAVRPVAGSLLGTFEGATISDGGRCATARVPKMASYTIGATGNMYNVISSFPVENYNGPVKKGCYSWWCPDDPFEFTFKPHGNQSCYAAAGSKLVSSIELDDKTQSFRFEFCFMFEVLSRSSLYVYGFGGSHPAFWQMMQAMRVHIPVAMENNTHRSWLSRVWNNFKKWISKPSNIAKTAGAAATMLLV
jgi:hypothetical protein